MHYLYSGNLHPSKRIDDLIVFILIDHYDRYDHYEYRHIQLACAFEVLSVVGVVLCVCVCLCMLVMFKRNKSITVQTCTGKEVSFIFALILHKITLFLFF